MPILFIQRSSYFFIHRNSRALVLLSILLHVAGCTVQQQYLQYPTEAFRMPIGEEGAWGYVDENKKLVIPLQYDTVGLFKYGLAVVRLEGRYGYLTTSGEFQIRLAYTMASDFYFGCAKVSNGAEEYYINRKGRRLQPSECELFNIVKGCNWPAPPTPVESYAIWDGHHYALTYKQTLDTTEFVFDSVATFNRNLLRVYKDGKVGFHWIYTPRNEVYGVSLVNALNFPYEDVRVRYFMWDSSSPDGDVRFAEVRRNGKWGLVNWKLQEVIAPQYLAIHRTLGENYILVEYEPGKQGYIDYDGREYFSRD